MKLSQKLLYLFFIFFMALFVCLVVFVHWVEAQGIKNQLRRDFMTLAQNLAKDGDQLIRNNNPGNLYLVFKDRIEKANAQQRLLYLRIIDEQANIYFSYKKKQEELQRTKYRRDRAALRRVGMNNAVVTETLSSNLGDVYDVSIRFDNDNGAFLLRSGFLLGGKVAINLNIFLILFAFLGLLTVAFVVIINRVIVKPLETLRDEAISITRGVSREFTLPRLRDDEIGDLYRALDNLVRELRAKQKALAEQEKLAVIGRGTGRLTHNISNLLNPLDNAFEDIRKGIDAADAPAVARDALRTIERHFQLVRHDLDRLRKAVPDAPHREPYPLSLLVDAALSRLFIPENIEVVNKVAAESIEVLVDPEQMTVVIYNLALNALQAMPDGGRLTITADGRRAKALLHIADTGCGIPREQQTVIFQFFQSTKKDGMGIGLASSLEIVRHHNGSISLDSEPGKGSVFTITLPLVKKE